MLLVCAGCARTTPPPAHAESNVPLMPLGELEDGDTKYGRPTSEGLPGYYFRGRRGESLLLTLNSAGDAPAIAILLSADGSAIDAARLVTGTAQMTRTLPDDGWYFVGFQGEDDCGAFRVSREHLATEARTVASR